MLAPASWNSIEFISDLHLQARDPLTFAAFSRFLAQCDAGALIILGDLFEVWVGDDVLSAAESNFERQCEGMLRFAATRMPVYLMRGNRDFLLGSHFFRSTGLSELVDPTVLEFQGLRILLTHGDALCLSDHDYLAYRAEVRSPGWQTQFLGQPLAQRLELAHHMRMQSMEHQRLRTDYADLDKQACENWLEAADASVLLHGHTHRPGHHKLSHGRSRRVLSDWDANAPVPRMETLRLDISGWHRLALPDLNDPETRL